jgi:hypothetical protein
MHPYSGDDRSALLALARSAVIARVRGTSWSVPRVAGALAEPGAAFVSLHAGDRLRGCLGCIEPRPGTVAETVAHMAAAAAGDDPRFAPLAPEELDDTIIEVSILGPLVVISGPDDVVPGRDGLVVEHHGQRGLLLPQVATTWGWDARTFLAETCRKAGLPRTAWQEGAHLYRFEAEVFAESPRVPCRG